MYAIRLTIKFKFCELITYSVLHSVYNFYLKISISLCIPLRKFLSILLFSVTTQKYFLSRKTVSHPIEITKL